MFVIVEREYAISSLLNSINDRDQTPIILYKIVLSDKKTNKNNFQLLKDKLTEDSFNYIAVQITLEKIDNTTPGYVDSLKKMFNIVIGLGGLNKVNRYFLESTNIDFLQDPHNSLFKPKIDFIHHFNSGMNHVLFNIAKEKGIGILVSTNIFRNKDFVVSKEFARANQNARFSRKYKVPFVLTGFIRKENQIKDKVQMRGIMSFFNLSKPQVEASLNLLELKVKENIFKNSENYICDGIKVVEK